ncbi:hypothetical protein U0X36_04900 [Bacillus thuringiensis]|uniref:hypothetical protein n=1 Tax=Bacillus thuringiensis TaxID=1428 RepID=UPI000E53EE64|nr:hypothetical protein [Bacillus thuringiensis]MDZ3952291.1 hypothetical protein [Bacillus thuringiensis]
MQNFSASKQFGISYGSLEIQDYYDLHTYEGGFQADMYVKWNKVKAFFSTTNSNQNKIWLNHLSGTSSSASNLINKWITLWFVASGNQSRDTNSSNKHLTPIVEGEPMNIPPSQYPDYPAILDSFYEKWIIYYEGTNNLTTQWIKNNRVPHVGIIAADFPGKGLLL